MVTATSHRDGIHLDANQHEVLGKAIANIAQVAPEPLQSGEPALVGA
jgi:hypothetical protein